MEGDSGPDRDQAHLRFEMETGVVREDLRQSARPACCIDAAGCETRDVLPGNNDGPEVAVEGTAPRVGVGVDTFYLTRLF